MSKHHNGKNDFTEKVGTRMTVIAWIVVLGMLTIIFSGHLQRLSNPNQQVQSVNINGTQEVVLNQNRSGHYIATAVFNDVPVDVIVDTGATNVSVPENVANKLGLVKGQRMNVSTANGTISVYSTMIKSIKLGNIVVYDVRASINPFMGDDIVLLGMSYLDHLEFSHSNNELVLKQVNN